MIFSILSNVIFGGNAEEVPHQCDMVLLEVEDDVEEIKKVMDRILSEVEDSETSLKVIEVPVTSDDVTEDFEVLEVPEALKISIPTEIYLDNDQQDSGLPPDDDELWPENAAVTTACQFVTSCAHAAQCRRTWPQAATLPPAQLTATAKRVKRKALGTKKIMAAEVVLHQNEPHCFATSQLDRPFKLLVQKETFLIDADSMSRISPIFNIMCFGKDFEKMDLSREIVDEKSKDIDCFLRAVHDTSTINSTNFALVLRLSNKYQVEPIIEACQQFIMRQHLDVLKPDEILTMLIASYEHHCQKEVVQKLIRRLASEGNTVFTKLRISRFLPAQVYGSVISTSMNLSQVREHESMNGHVLKLERSKIRWRQSVCEECKSIAECGSCEECKKNYCRNHVGEKKCVNEYGIKLLGDLRKKIVDFEWND